MEATTSAHSDDKGPPWAVQRLRGPQRERYRSRWRKPGRIRPVVHPARQRNRLGCLSARGRSLFAEPRCSGNLAMSD